MDEKDLLWTCGACGKEDPAIYVDAEGLFHDEDHICHPLTTAELDAAYVKAVGLGGYAGKVEQVIPEIPPVRESRGVDLRCGCRVIFDLGDVHVPEMCGYEAGAPLLGKTSLPSPVLQTWLDEEDLYRITTEGRLAGR